MSKISSKSKWFMGGTEGTGTYKVVAKTALGAVGIREFSPGEFRVRVEPTDAGRDALSKVLTPDAGWDNQPGDGGQDRFSATASGKGSEKLVGSVTSAVHAIIAGGNVPEVNPHGFAFAKRLVSREGLVAAVKAQKVPGANLASSWPLTVLCKKIAA